MLASIGAEYLLGRLRLSAVENHHLPSIQPPARDAAAQALTSKDRMSRSGIEGLLQGCIVLGVRDLSPGLRPAGARLGGL